MEVSRTLFKKKKKLGLDFSVSFLLDYRCSRNWSFKRNKNFQSCFLNRKLSGSETSPTIIIKVQTMGWAKPVKLVLENTYYNKEKSYPFGPQRPRPCWTISRYMKKTFSFPKCSEANTEDLQNNTWQIFSNML